MDQTYLRLLGEWREAAHKTRETQAALSAQFEAHMAGSGSAPGPRELDELTRLREIEGAKLDALLGHVSATARGLRPSGG